MIVPRLTLRKVSILLHLEAGRSYKEIAAVLEIHPETVREHIQQIADDMGWKGAPKDGVLLFCKEMLVFNADVVANVKRRDNAA